jgi:phosphohistidine phosphatase
MRSWTCPASLILMLRLALLRHSEAHAHAQGGDKERSLNKAGRKMAARMGDYCRRMNLKPDVVLVSPARRTKETYEIVAEEIGGDLKVTFDPALYSATSTTIKELVAEVTSNCKVVLVVGHNPSIAESAIALAGRGDLGMLTEMRGHFPAPALAVIDFAIETWAEIAAGEGHLDRFVTKTMLSG